MITRGISSGKKSIYQHPISKIISKVEALSGFLFPIFRASAMTGPKLARTLGLLTLGFVKISIQHSFKDNFHNDDGEEEMQEEWIG